VLSDWCLGFLMKILLKNAIIIGFLRQRFVCFLKLYLATHISQTQGSFNSVFVIFVNVQTCCLALIHHRLMQFIGMSSSKWKSSYDKGQIHNSNEKRHFFS